MSISSSPAIVTRGLTMSYGRVRALNDVSFDVAEGL